MLGRHAALRTRLPQAAHHLPQELVRHRAHRALGGFAPGTQCVVPGGDLGITAHRAHRGQIQIPAQRRTPLFAQCAVVPLPGLRLPWMHPA